MDKRFLGDSEAIKLGEIEFAKMTKSEKRVAIAKDVIAAISAKVFKASVGMFLKLSPSDDEGNGTWEYDGNGCLRDSIFVEARGKCEVCAMGGLFACAVLRQNGLSESDVNLDEDGEISKFYISDHLEQYFDPYQLKMIEMAFEMGRGFYRDMYAEYDSTKFGQMFNNDELRLIAIMQNIIDNNGEFRPEEALHAVQAP